MRRQRRTFLPQDRRHPKTTVAHIGNSRNHEPELTLTPITENVESFPSCVSPWVDAHLRQPHTSYTLQDHGARAASPGVSVYVAAFAGTELYCSVIAAHKREQLTRPRSDSESDSRPLYRKSDALPLRHLALSKQGMVAQSMVGRRSYDQEVAETE